MRPALRRAAIAGAACTAAIAVGVLTDRAPYPYAQNLLLDIPLPFLTPTRLTQLLRPRAGEQMLEIGAGTGLQTLHVAPRLGPDGVLAAVDVQRRMLDHVMARAAERSVGNITPYLADARDLPFPDGQFDAAYLVTVLGEIPGRQAALRELRRVLKPEGRLVIGEFADKHYVPLATLARLANEVGLHLSHRTGVPFAYYALLTPCPFSGPNERAITAPPGPTSFP